MDEVTTKYKVGRQKSEVRSRRAEVGSKKSEVRSRKYEVGSKKSEVRSTKYKVGSQKSEVRSPKYKYGVYSIKKGKWVAINMKIRNQKHAASNPFST